MTDTNVRPFWRAKRLEDMDENEWESLCDGCAKCCLIKLEDVDTCELSYTNIACRLLDLHTCKCADYQNRTVRVPDCLRVTPELARTANWLPPTCAYRLIAEQKDLKWWHPLVSGDPRTVHTANISVRQKVVHESERLEPEDHIVTWLE
ncbi:MAG: YcgN family cysteine cluster protein [Pseudomonadota bacterium]|nr:YcgN family cysteine cluster protein [Pseudomonadota bacterium]